MKVLIFRLLTAVRSNFWFIPSLLTLSAIAGAFALLEADFALREQGFLAQFVMPIESARLALSTIAGSMITMASLVFSMTLVALTLVSQQLGPRILMRFMDDRPTQVVLGLFVATFLFALIILIRTGEEAYAGRVPGIAVVVTATLAVLSLGAMIHFIHHIATRLQADVLVSELGRDLRAAASSLSPGAAGIGEYVPKREQQSLNALFEDHAIGHVSATASGYLLQLDTETAVGLAQAPDLVIRMDARPGQFVLQDEPVMTLATRAAESEVSSALTEKLERLIVVGPRRTPEASVEFEIDALVEVALRALSPGINDTFTATTCVDRLCDGLRCLMQRDSEQRVVRDPDGVVRFMHAPEPFSRYLSKAFGPICYAADDNPMVLEKLLHSIERLQERASDQEQQYLLEKQAGLIRSRLEASTTVD